MKHCMSTSVVGPEHVLDVFCGSCMGFLVPGGEVPFGVWVLWWGPLSVRIGLMIPTPTLESGQHSKPASCAVLFAFREYR